jgi:hypothetical protein
MEVHLSVPPSKLYHMPLPFYAMTGHILTTLARLRACASPSPDHTEPLYFNLAQLIERTAAHLEEAGGGRIPSRGQHGAIPVYGGSKKPVRKGRNDRLSHWSAWLRRCARALGIADGSSARQDIPGFVCSMGTCWRDAARGREGVADLTAGDTAGQNGRQQGTLGGQDTAADGYTAPPSGLDVGGAVEGGAADSVLPPESDSFPMEWTAALLEDISGFGLFGLSDDFLMQDMFAGGDGGGDIT